MLFVWAALVVGLIVLLTSCHTAEAVEQLPEGYWMATERLVLAFLEDVWSVVEWLL